MWMAETMKRRPAIMPKAFRPHFQHFLDENPRLDTERSIPDSLDFIGTLIEGKKSPSTKDAAARRASYAGRLGLRCPWRKLPLKDSRG